MAGYRSVKKTSTLLQFIKATSRTTTSKDFLLFRGQSQDWDLLPKIVRVPALNNSQALDLEKDIFDDFCRRSRSFLTQIPVNYWEWLTIGQHFGLATRLIDWSSNPLVALWFACKDNEDEDSYVYCLDASKQIEISEADRNKELKDITDSKVYRPTMNNSRIIAQKGWFTVHAHNGAQFPPLHQDPLFGNSITKLVIPKTVKSKMLAEISQLGVNHQTMFPDIEGLTQHLNSKYGCK